MFAVIVYAKQSKAGPHDFVLSVGETQEQTLERYRNSIGLPETCCPFTPYTRVELVEIYGKTRLELTEHRHPRHK